MPDYTVILTRDVTMSAVVKIHDAADELEAEERALDDSNEYLYELDEIMGNTEVYITDVTKERANESKV